MPTPLLSAALLALTVSAAPTPSWEKEVVYQIFPRSFYDSDGDRIGDLKGIAAKLDYLKGLGVTAILLNPIVASRAYHNYFADDFFSVEPKYGTNRDFVDLMRKAHAKGLKVILDMETQYVADQHPWYVAVDADPISPYRAFLWMEGSAFYHVPIHWWDGADIQIASVRSDNSDVQAYFQKVFRYWAAPGGKPADGVDGFRIDHMMDDLDDKGVDTNMFRTFWAPIEQAVRQVHPGAFFLAEQADWGFGQDHLTKGGVDAVFAFPLRFDFVSLDKKKLEATLAKTQEITPAGKTQFVFIENHDLDRFASVANGDPALLRLGAVFNLTVKGAPILYMGQELGMKGKAGKWNSDGNDIPRRLAFRWNRTLEAPGAAIWYRNSGPWWSTEYSRDGDGVSVEEEAPRPDSLLNFYRRLIALREKTPALREGDLRIVPVDNPNVLAFTRQAGDRKVTVVLNLSNQPQALPGALAAGRDLLGGPAEAAALPAYGYRIADASGS